MLRPHPPHNPGRRRHWCTMSDAGIIFNFFIFYFEVGKGSLSVFLVGQGRTLFVENFGVGEQALDVIDLQ